MPGSSRPRACLGFLVQLSLALLLAATWLPADPARAQDAEPPAVSETETETPEGEVQVQPEVADEAIEERLQRILQASGWFQDPAVEVSEGLVFLDGRTTSAERREWAGNVARRAQDVVAVVNRITVVPSADWSFAPARQELRRLATESQRALPIMVLAVAVLALTWFLARLVGRIARRTLSGRIASPLLLTVLARAAAVPVVLVGLYLVLQFAGLTRLALTVLGGTGLMGLVIGFAFRDIAENFLASLLLSVRNPFNMGDLVRIGDHEGIVRNLNTRSTLLFTLDGNHVQIPNATVYKSVITNFSSSSGRRTDFVVGIGYEDSVGQAQEVIGAVLAAHPAVKDEPKPQVLVDQLAASTVNLKIYAWFDSQTYSPNKLRSALMRQIKGALMENGISMPDEAREVIFPQGLRIIQETAPTEREAPREALTQVPAMEDAATVGSGLENEDVLRQEDTSTVPETQENLLVSRRPRDR